MTKIEQRNAIEQFLRTMFGSGDIIEIRGLGSWVQYRVCSATSVWPPKLRSL